MTATLPPGQRRVLDFIWDYWRDHQRPPGYREIAAAIGSPYPNAAVTHVRPLAEKGHIEIEASGKARSVWPAGLRQAIRSAVESAREETE